MEPGKEDKPKKERKSRKPPLLDNEYGLNPKQVKFAQLYVTEEFFMHGQNAYAKAYGYDVTNPQQRNVCRSGASTLLLNPNLQRYINDLLGDLELTDVGVDKQLNKIIQQDVDFKAKIMGITEYNKLRSRIKEKSELTLKGDAAAPVQIQVTIVNAHQTTEEKK